MQAKKITRAQPAGLKFRIALGGNQCEEGGKGDYNSPLPPSGLASADMVVDSADDGPAVEPIPQKVKKEKRADGDSPKRKKVKKEE